MLCSQKVVKIDSKYSSSCWYDSKLVLTVPISSLEDLELFCGTLIRKLLLKHASLFCPDKSYLKTLIYKRILPLMSFLQQSITKRFVSFWRPLWYRVRPCERRNIPTLIFLRNSKHILFSIFSIYRIYCIQIKFLFLQNTCSNLNSDSKIWLRVWNAALVPSVLSIWTS